MSLFARAIKIVGVFGGITLVWIVLGLLSARHSVFYVSVLAAAVLPVSCWHQYRFGLLCAAFIGAAIAFAASPIDILVRSDSRTRVRVLPAKYGIFCNTAHACYGCLVPIHPAKAAVVISYRAP